MLSTFIARWLVLPITSSVVLHRAIDAVRESWSRYITNDEPVKCEHPANAQVLGLVRHHIVRLRWRVSIANLSYSSAEFSIFFFFFYSFSTRFAVTVVPKFLSKSHKVRVMTSDRWRAEREPNSNNYWSSSCWWSCTLTLKPMLIGKEAEHEL